MLKHFLLFFVCSFTMLGQFVDDFSDGDFTNNPIWQGQTTKFEVLSQQLHLQDALNDSPAYLITEVATKDSTIWEFYFSLDFDPSTNNHAKVYLTANSADLSAVLNGYYVKLGGVSGTIDRIQLFKQTENEDVLLVEGNEGDAAISPSGRIQVVRDSNSNWTLGYDLTGGTNYTYFGGDIADNEHEIGTYMGVYCKYTSSNIDAFYFDDFYVNPIYVDDEAPKLVNAEIISGNEIVLTFNEPLDLTTAQNINNYEITGIGNPDLAILNPETNNIVTLTFPNNFIDETTLEIVINDVEDLAGNVLSTSISLFYNIATLYEVVITEIMANPSGVFGLPEAEYIELYNRSAYPINIKNWLLQDNSSSPKILPEFVIEPGAYITLVDEDEAINFTLEGIGNLPIDLPGLTNGGELIQLLDENGNLIFSIEYSDEWYKNSDKADGGWSLEMINFDNPCGGYENWQASNNSRGGTPSKQNSVYDSNAIDTTPLDVVRVGIINQDTIQVYFAEPVNVDLLSNGVFNIDNGLGNPVSFEAVLPNFESVVLTLPQSLLQDIVYTLSITNLQDCAGNSMGEMSEVQFALPKQIDSADLVINEILFDQTTGNVDYLEIYNRSNKVLDLKNCRVLRASVDYENLLLDPLLVTKNIIESSFLIFPQGYICLSANQRLVKQQYFTQNPYGFIDVPSFPTYDANLGAAVIQDSLGNTLDAFVYYKNYHNDLIDQTKGVSLEKIDFNQPSNNPDNWHSASASVGYGTPAYENSQFYNIPELQENFTVEPTVFSPDGDGNAEFTTIGYTMDEPGFTANIYVHDDRGREINHLVKNELLGNSGFYRWDGTDANGEKANIGIYILFIEIFDLNGKVDRFKKTVTLAGQLR